MPVYTYRIFGISVESDLPFPELTPSSDGKKSDRTRRVIFRKRDFPVPPESQDWVFSYSLAYAQDPERRFVFVRSPLGGNFRVDLLKRRMDWKPTEKSSLAFARMLASLRILGLLLPHLKPSLLLHASCLVIDGKSICLLGPAGGGKSTLAASFLERGFGLLSDDLAVIQMRRGEFFLQPGLRDIRLWPKTARRFNHREIEGKTIAPEIKKRRFPLGLRTPWRFAENPVPLKALYVLSRKRKGEIEIESLKGREALICLSRNLYNRIVEAPKILHQQFEIATHLVRHVPVKRLRYPSGFAHLPQVRQAILNDLNAS